MKKVFSRNVNGKILSLTTAAVLVATNAIAFTAPATTDFGYEIYDMAYNNVLQGPIGYVMAMGLAAFGLWTCIDAKKGGMALGIPMMAMGAVIKNVDKLATAIGGTF